MLSQVKPFHVKSNQIMSRKCQVKVKSSQVKFRQVKSRQFKSHQFKSRHVKFSQVKPRLYPTLGLRTVLYLREIITLLQIYEGSKLDFRSWVLWFVKDPIKYSPFCRQQLSSRMRAKWWWHCGTTSTSMTRTSSSSRTGQTCWWCQGQVFYVTLCNLNNKSIQDIDRLKPIPKLNKNPNPTQPHPGRRFN